MLKRRTNAQLIADLRARLDQGHVEATAERAMRIAARTHDADLLRELVQLLAQAVANPKPRKAARPTTNLQRTPDGAIDLDATTPQPLRARMEAMRNMVSEWETCEKINATHTRHGTKIEFLLLEHGIGKSTYYKWFPAGSR